MDNEPNSNQPNDNRAEPVGTGPFSSPPRPQPVTPADDDLPTPVTSQPQFGTPNKKSGSKWVVALLVVLVLGALGGVAYWQYTDANSTRSQLSSVENELSLAKAQINKLSAAPEDDSDTDTTTEAEDFSAFLLQYDAIQKAAVSFNDTDKAAIEKGIKDYYKLTTLPSGWAILSVYKDAKADETTGKPLNALIYWPAGDKPAGFFEMNQSATGTWTYNDLR